ncbi:hypothetical protein BH23ACT11_BH23ACT11_08730 [soil metagenome]
MVSFAILSAAAGLRILYSLDLWALRVSQIRTNSTFDLIGEVFSRLGSVEVTVSGFGVLLIWLFLTNKRTLSIRLAAAMLITGLVELAMKLWLPQVPMPEEASRTEGFSPVVDVPYSYPYPSGHLLRSMILFGAIYLLWTNKIARVLIIVALTGMSLSRVYLGVHWASDVIGGVLLGLAGLVWAFGKQSAISNQLSAKSRQQ